MSLIKEILPKDNNWYKAFMDDALRVARDFHRRSLDSYCKYLPVRKEEDLIIFPNEEYVRTLSSISAIKNLGEVAKQEVFYPASIIFEQDGSEEAEDEYEFKKETKVDCVTGFVRQHSEKNVEQNSSKKYANGIFLPIKGLSCGGGYESSHSDQHEEGNMKGNDIKESHTSSASYLVKGKVPVKSRVVIRSIPVLREQVHQFSMEFEIQGIVSVEYALKGSMSKEPRTSVHLSFGRIMNDVMQCTENDASLDALKSEVIQRKGVTLSERISRAFVPISFEDNPLLELQTTIQQQKAEHEQQKKDIEQQKKDIEQQKKDIEHLQKKYEIIKEQYEQVKGINMGTLLTGGNAHATGTQAPLVHSSSVSCNKNRPRGQLVPLREFFTFGLENIAMKTFPKLKEMNNLQPDGQKLDESQINALNQIATEPVYEATDLHVSALESGLQWSVETVTPMLDIFRVALLNFKLNAIFFSNEAVANQFEQTKHHVQIAAASALAIFTLLLLNQAESGSVTKLGPREDVLKAVIGITENVASFCNHSPIALARILQAIATLMWEIYQLLVWQKTGAWLPQSTGSMTQSMRSLPSVSHVIVLT
uniref:PUL domain-containing protein n=1 Tax=Ditylenchus dipsaci TaxID=166011 RepID=A0A915EDK6_9BILA